MTIFNPQVQSVETPNYFGYSKPIENVNLSSTLGKGLAGAGKIIEEAAKGADLYIEDQAKRETRDTLEPVRDEYSNALRTADNQMRYAANLTPLNTDRSSTAQTLAPGPTNILGNSTAQTMPDDIRALPNSLSTLQSARANGKISETDFAMRTNTLLKDIRSKYPSAYREVIDSEASKVLGFNPANKEITSRLQDINSYMTSGQAEFNHTLRKIQDSGYPGSEIAYKNMSSGKWSVQDGVNWMAPFQQNDFLRKKAREDMSDETLTTDVQTKRAEKSASEIANSLVSDSQHNTTFLAGMKNLDQIRQEAINGLTGRGGPRSSEQWGQLADLMLAHKAMTTKRIEEEFARSENGKFSINGFLSPEKIKQIKERALAPYDEIEKLFRDEKSGLVYDSFRRQKSIHDDALLRARSDTDTGGLMTMTSIYRQELGDDLASKIALNNLLKIGVPKFSNMLEQAQAGISSEDPRIKKQTMNGALDDIITNGRSDPAFKYEFPKYTRRLFDMIDGPDVSLTSNKTPEGTKEQIALNTFGTKNAGMLTKIPKDEYVTDPNTGKTKLVTGAQQVFAGFTQPQVVEAMNKRSPQAKAYYQDWVSTTAEQDLLKFDAAKLKELPITQLKDIYNLELKYNPTSNEFELASNQSQNLMRRSTRDLQGVRTSMNESQFLNVRDSLARVNTVLAGLRNVGEGMGKGPEYPIEVLLGATGRGEMDDKGNITGFDVLSIPGLPPTITNPVRAEREQELKRREEIKTKYGTK